MSKLGLHKISGKPTDRIDSREKVTGEAKFTGDIHLPGMLYARLLRPPVHGAKSKRVDNSAAGKIKGVHIIQDNELTAVLHEHPQAAEKALKLVTAQYDLPEKKVNNHTIFNHLLNVASEKEIVAETGNLREGGITMGLGYVLKEEIHFRGGEIMDKNFDTYELPRFSWVPKIETRLIDNPEMPPQGCGEPAITTMEGVIANAVYDAIGIRLFELPMTPKRIKNVLKKQKSIS